MATTYRLSTFLRRHVDTALSPRGWRRDGQNYFFDGADGDVANINFQRSHSSHGSVTVFFINTGAVPRPLLEYKLDKLGQRGTDRERPIKPLYYYGYDSAGWAHRERVPQGAGGSVGRDDGWTFDADDPVSIAECGQALSHLLIGTTAPRLEALGDREQFIANLEPRFGPASAFIRCFTAVFAAERGERVDVENLKAHKEDDEHLVTWTLSRLELLGRSR